MMKQNKQLIAALIGTLILLASCTEIIDIELGSTYRHLVVSGFISTDSVLHRVKLSGSSDYFSNSPSAGIGNALVELEFDDTIIRLVEQDTLPGLYLVPEAFRGVPGTTYLLRINQVDANNDGIEEHYTAHSTMPVVPGLDSVRLEYFQSPFVSGYQVMMYAQDPPGRDWYRFRLWKNSDLLTDTLSKFIVQSDDLINGTYIYGFPVGFLRDDLPREEVLPGDTVTFEMNGIDQSFYNFVMDAQLEIMGNNPLFSGPPANVRSNVDNEAMGIFAAYSINRYSVILE